MFVSWRVQRHRRATWNLLGRKEKNTLLYTGLFLIFQLILFLPLYEKVFLAVSTNVSKFCQMSQKPQNKSNKLISNPTSFEQRIQLLHSLYSASSVSHPQALVVTEESLCSLAVGECGLISSPLWALMSLALYISLMGAHTDREKGCTFSQRNFSWRRMCWDEGLQYSSPILTTWGLATRKTKVQGLFLNTALWTWQQASRELWECLQCSKVFYVLQHVVKWLLGCSQ